MATKKSSTVEERLVKEALQRRINEHQVEQKQAQQYADGFLDRAALPWQKVFIKDPHSSKALFGERRAAKTSTLVIYSIYTALLTANSKILYIGLTSDSSQRAIYDEIFPNLIRTHQIPATLKGEDTITFSNGSIIYLVGVDSDKRQSEKIRGIKSSLNMIDEMQSFTQDTQKIIKEVLGPAAADTNAPTIIGGTAGQLIGDSYWYEITKENTRDNPINFSKKHPEWKVYRCSWKNNTAIDVQTGNRVCDNIQTYFDNQIKLNPDIIKSPSFRKEWNAEWILENTGAYFTHEIIDHHKKNPPTPWNQIRKNRVLTNEQLMNPSLIIDEPELPYCKQIVIGFDPAGSMRGDECGIIVVALYSDNHAYILEDASGHYNPAGYAMLINDLYLKYKADGIIVETNFGGKESFEYILHSVNSYMNIIPIHSKTGKITRAEHISALYTQGRVHHPLDINGIAKCKELEDQMCYLLLFHGIFVACSGD